MSIDVAIPGDRNVIKNEAEKILIYKKRKTEIQRMWNVKTKVIPVIRGATGTISKSLRLYLSNVPGKHEIKELQITAILGTAHRLRESKSTKHIYIGEITLHVAQIVNTEQLQHCIPYKLALFQVYNCKYTV